MIFNAEVVLEPTPEVIFCKIILIRYFDLKHLLKFSKLRKRLRLGLDVNFVVTGIMSLPSVRNDPSYSLSNGRPQMNQNRLPLSDRLNQMVRNLNLY